ncbi:MAG: hypothetical protein WAM04_06705, partial [Candidatus Sulfotelmatobacter sp.]
MSVTLLNPVQQSTHSSAESKPNTRLRSWLWIGALGVVTAGAMALFYELVSDQAVEIMVAGVCVFALLWIVMAVSGTSRSRNLVFALWWVL